MKTVEITLYKFEELSKEAKSKAIEKLYDINVSHNWWDCTYEDAKTIELEIASFDLDRNKHATGKIQYSAMSTAKLIIANHGEKCETYKLASKFIEECEKYDEIEDLEEQFETDLLSEYANMLQRESEYLMSDKAVIETIKANEYDFTVDGTIY